MQNHPGFNIALSFNNIHNIITRGLRVSIDCVQVVERDGSRNKCDCKGLFNYIRALSSVLNAHHLTEDEVAFPYFRSILPDVRYGPLIAQHQVMVRILGEVKVAVDMCEKYEQFELEIKNLESALKRLNKIWHPHIKIENNDFMTKADALLPVEEQFRLVAQFSEYNQKLALPAYLTVPFMIYNLPMDERKLFIQGMPSEVILNLVPIVWKEKWASMTPYLLT